MFFVFLVGCPPKVIVDPNNTMTQQHENSSVENTETSFSGTYLHGVFRDKIFPLEGLVSDSWEVQFQEEHKARRFRAQHRTESVVVEIWQFSEIILQPAQYDFCSWSFLDRGYYSNTREKQITSTCIPNDLAKNYVFAYLYHWGGSTWQFEIHTDLHTSMKGKTIGEDLLRQFIWHGVEDIRVLQP